MRLKQKLLRGLNLRASDINRDPTSASDLKNVELDRRRQLRKRFGYDLDVALPANSIDLMDYIRGNSILSLTPTALRERISGPSFRTVNFGGIIPPNGWIDIPAFGEYNGILYWTDPRGLTDLFKYDGFMAYRAGLPQPENVSYITGAGTRFWRVVYKHIDLQGNVIWGDFFQLETQGVDNPTITLDTLNSSEFHSKYSLSNGAQTIDSGDLVFETTDHNYVTGDFVSALNSNGDFIILEVESFTAGTDITFTAASVGTNTFNLGAAEPIERRNFIVSFYSNNAGFGWRQAGEQTLSNVSTGTINISPNTAVDLGPMLGIYDDQRIKGLPPKFKFLTFYGNLMVGANSSEKIDSVSENEGVAEDTIYWSDLSVGSGVETFSPDDFQVIGRTDEGDITGIFSNKYNVVVGKSRQIYYLSGDLINRNFRVFSSLSNGVGCLSHRSMIEVEDGVMFLSSKGLNVARNGSKPINIANSIQPLFTENTTGLDFTKAKSVNDIINERIYIYIPATADVDSLVVMYDYHFKEWFLYKDIIADGGIVMLGNDLFHANDTNIFKRSSTFNDNGSPIDAFYATAWFDAGEPSIRKKWVNFITISIGAVASWVLNLKSQKDWDTSVNADDFTQQFAAGSSVDDHKLKMEQTEAMRFIIGNNVLNEGIFVSGYEIEYEETQMKPKGQT